MKYILILCSTGLLFATSSCKKYNSSAVTIQPANRPPIANAGQDTTIVLPKSHLILDGSKSSDPDNRPLTYKWTKVSGPEHIYVDPSFYQDSAPSHVEIDFHETGEYLFELTVTNNLGLFSKALVKIIVAHSTLTEHRIDWVFDRNSTCMVDGNFPGINNYDGANFRLYAKSGVSSEETYIDQEYEKYGTSYFYPPGLTLANRAGAIYFHFISSQNFFTLPYNSGSATFSDSVAVIYGIGSFANVLKDTRIYCTGTADTTNHTGKISLLGSIYY